MQLIKKGNSREICCPDCGSIFIWDDEDVFVTTMKTDDRGLGFYVKQSAVNCPICSKTFKVDISKNENN